jgi:ABC-type amino acid transport substrate-binding protein
MTRISKISLVLLALLASAATTRAQQTPDARVADIVNAGKLRFGLFPPQYVKDPVTSDLKSAWVEVARALAGRIGVELVLLEHPTPPKAIECLQAGACDAIFLPRDDRAAGVADFSAPYCNSSTRCWCRRGPRSAAFRTLIAAGCGSRLCATMLRPML